MLVSSTPPKRVLVLDGGNALDGTSTEIVCVPATRRRKHHQEVVVERVSTSGAMISKAHV